MTATTYTSMLNAGIGMIDETRILLDLWNPGMSMNELNQIALKSGQFPNITARRLRNLIAECFKPRYLVNNGKPAVLLKLIQPFISNREFRQLLFVFTCRESRILADFVHELYWNAYISGREKISNEDALLFVSRANQDGKTSRPWSEGTILRVSSYLTSSCADFGLLEEGSKMSRQILPYRIEPQVAIILAHDLHFAGHGDNHVLSDPDWALFGMDRSDVLNELKRQALKGWFIIQSAGDAARIGWQYQNMEELINAFNKG